MGDWAAVVVAGFALSFSIWQWLDARRKFLLGDKETVGYQAIRIASRKYVPTSQESVRVLILAALFEGSERARLQVYRALSELSRKPRHQKLMIDYRAKIVASALSYRQALDLRNLDKRLKQLDKSLPWIVGDQGEFKALSDDVNVTLAVKWRACEGKEERVARALELVTPLSQAEPGCVYYHAQRSDADPREFLLLEQYRNRSAFEEHKAKAYFKQYIDCEARPLVSEKVTFYTVADRP